MAPSEIGTGKSEFWHATWSEKARVLVDQSLHVIDGYQFLTEGEYVAVVQHALAPVSLPPRASLLEVGCGAGAFLHAVGRSRPDVSLAGVDVSDAMVALGRSRLPLVDFVRSDARELSAFPDDSFDVTTSFGMLCYLDDLEHAERVLDEMVRVTRRGGTILLGDTSDAVQVEASREFLARVWGPRTIPEYLYFDFEFFRRYGKAAGLPVRIVPMDRLVPEFYEPRRFRFCVYLGG